MYELTPGADVHPACAACSAALFTGIGVCDTYSAAFATMAWKLGVPMYLVVGATSTTKGGYTPHVWCQMDAPDGTVYVFDPHIDYLNTLRGSGAPGNVRFEPTQAQASVPGNNTAQKNWKFPFT